ncbi:hypothetical protein Asppvi_002054 [Aspergillus pseudoviridinutans]|uniref:Uncharacterized protein n=1 Tax=Aspergillus pseudoviridinutans TaxID=1517512 RepID=A0A9P3BKB6_9EURO|nr:uncharacterized protein Asppvi_002054 [Aspergillus pseudoviridinutans]GIJ92776.1 hypothetical protein Asppvi_002054 [Aspergillus pseudoviridinutans]
MDLPPDSTSSKAPTAYVKIKWKNIAKEHQHLCDKNGNNWNRRTDLKTRTGEEMAHLKLKEAWIRQEIRYNNWIRGAEVGTVERSPTPFPLDEYRRRREESRGPLKVRPGTTIKREETPRASTEATEAASTPKPVTVADRVGTTSRSETEARVTSRAADRQTNMEQDSSGQENNSESQSTFSQKQYKEAMIKDMGLDIMRKEDMQAYVKAMALIQAEYATYRAYMLKHGAVEVV